MEGQIASLVRKLREEGEAVQARLAALTPAQWSLPVYTGGQGWTARDVLAHLVSAERGHRQLIADVAGGGPGSSPDLDVDAYNRRHVAALAGRTPAELLADLKAGREETLLLVAGLADEDLARRANHPALGPDTALADFIRIIFVHAKIHVRDMARVASSA